MKKKNLFLITGITAVVLGLGWSRTKRSNTKSMNNTKILNDVNDEDLSGFSIPDMPKSTGRINLIRAVNDEAENIIKEITVRIRELDVERAQLVIELETHKELLKVAQKYLEETTIKG